MKHAFTLFELLVAMSVVAILTLATVGSIQLRPKKLAVEEGANQLVAMARAARAQAIMSGRPARLLINNEPSRPDSYMRQLGIVVETEVDSKIWVTVDRGATFPPGVFIDVSSSNEESADATTLVHPSNLSNLEGSATNGELQNWRALTFDPNGRLKGNSTIALTLAAGTWGGSGPAFQGDATSAKVIFKLSGFSTIEF